MKQSKTKQAYLHLLHFLYQPAKFCGASLQRSHGNASPMGWGRGGGRRSVLLARRPPHTAGPSKAGSTQAGLRPAPACRSPTAGAGKPGGAVRLPPRFRGMLVSTQLAREHEQPLHSPFRRSVCFTFSTKGGR